MILLPALLLTIFTGFTGLVYEVTWQKYLATLLGSHSEATAAVLGIFLGGLSVGYALFGRATRSIVSRARRRSEPARLLLFYALVEGVIGIYAAAFPILFGAVQRVSIAVPAESAAGGFAFDVLLSTILIGPPSVLMGGTIPILTLALTRKVENATRVHALIYGFNTVGAFAGALAGGFFLIPLLGLDHVLYAMGCINVAAAAGFVLLHGLSGRLRAHQILDVSTEPENPGATRVEGYYGLVAVAALSGFAMMTIQTVLNRVGALSFGASTFTFAMVVAVFVLSIALGSLAVSALASISARFIVASQWALLILLAGLYHWLPDAPYLAHVIRSLFRDIDHSLYAYHALAFAVMLCVLLIPIGLSGALLPLLFHHLRRSVGELGSIAGRLYSWNTAGSLGVRFWVATCCCSGSISTRFSGSPSRRC